MDPRLTATARVQGGAIGLLGRHDVCPDLRPRHRANVRPRRGWAVDHGAIVGWPRLLLEPFAVRLKTAASSHRGTVALGDAHRREAGDRRSVLTLPEQGVWLPRSTRPLKGAHRGTHPLHY